MRDLIAVTAYLNRHAQLGKFPEHRLIEIHPVCRYRKGRDMPSVFIRRPQLPGIKGKLQNRLRIQKRLTAEKRDLQACRAYFLHPGKDLPALLDR